MILSNFCSKCETIVLLRRKPKSGIVKIYFDFLISESQENSQIKLRCDRKTKENTYIMCRGVCFRCVFFDLTSNILYILNCVASVQWSGWAQVQTLEGLMKQLQQLTFLVCTLLTVTMLFPQSGEAIGLSGANIKAGVNLTRQQSFNQLQGIGGEFDSHQWVGGTNLDLGSVVLPALHFMPGVDFAIANTNVIIPGSTGSAISVDKTVKIYIVNTDFVYFFHQNARGRGYAGAGIGTHLVRPEGEAGSTRVTLNIPLGFQRKLGTGLGWFGELKLVIADDEQNSALQFSLGFTLGSIK